MSSKPWVENGDNSGPTAQWPVDKPRPWDSLVWRDLNGRPAKLIAGSWEQFVYSAYDRLRMGWRLSLKLKPAVWVDEGDL